MINLKKWSVVALMLLIGTAAVYAQCGTWTDLPNKDEIENAHVVYRPYLKDKTVDDLVALGQSDFDLAFTNWETAYNAAPAADGGRPTHYIDGVLLYQAMTKKTEDTAKKAEYAKKIVGLYDEYLQCYPKDEKLIRGRKAFDMFYSYGYGYTVETLEAIKKAMDVADNEAEYILLDPLGQTLVYLYQNDQVDKKTVQDMYKQGINFAEHNIENDHYYKDYYESGLANLRSKIGEIESEVFDCAYFKEDLLPKLDGEQDNWEVVSYVWNKLKTQGCEETDPELATLKSDFERLQEIEFRKNPCFDGSRLQKEEKYDEALARYEECLTSSEDPEVRAQVLYSMANILVWQKGQYSSAVAKAREAASVKSGWGKPYILMGDVISKRSQSCDDWNRRLAAIAAIDKYSYARSIDPGVSEEAGKRIGRLTAALPGREDGFMRKVSEGQSVTVSCIGETVKVRFRD
ncbi:MAG: hypothetical protein AAGJ82_04490 [Bacteroidota bacterium]